MSKFNPMLELDDPQWHDLQHAYGNASNIPALLRALASSTGPKKGYTDEPWFTLWSSLCHQGDAYTASYAAIPHVVQIAMITRTPVDFSFFVLPAAVELARRQGRGPDIPQQLDEDYRKSVACLGECVNLHLDDPWIKSMISSETTTEEWIAIIDRHDAE
ncbi:hypothetical protein [Rhizobium rhizogenes]|uniref:hypothetical protein n=1 Tax=Rhizobium rhizogenes TaxID=359 RepID=UPI0011464CAD|nr:hypothetical protein [Rhizobium rhizogenes]MDJ1634507.1 hypothetical protein [Rhizobium rhizogenes]NTG07442.1 hypothetical protein [Rhizobium rhizogenes]NTG73677.1 hypothetical protein [Rhizobium rhizogenes]NTG86402.1 hypothetical protein [Rhizobium rhizogenes]NTH12224.1 hypothetical protein [Rhizobium rhizogenes]